MTKQKKDKPEPELEKLKQQAKEYLAGWQRARADYQNLKKQTEMERQELIKFANLNLIMGLIPVYNNLKLSFGHLPKEIQGNEWVRGIQHIKKQFEEVLRQNGVEEIAPRVGDRFSPEVHEAVKQETDQSVWNEKQATGGAGKIEKVISCGYKLNGRVFLPARVVVK